MRNKVLLVMSLSTILLSVGAIGVGHLQSGKTIQDGVMASPARIADAGSARDRSSAVLSSTRVGAAVVGQSAAARIESVADLLSATSEFQQTAALYQLAARSNLAQIKQHLMDVRLLAGSDDRSVARNAFYLRFSELDPDGVLEHWREFGQTEVDYMLFTLFSGWAKFDLAGAIDRWDRLIDESEREEARDAIWDTREQIAQDTLDLLLVQMGLGEIDEFRSQALFAKVRTDPVAAVSAALEIEDIEERQQVLEVIATLWARDDAPSALAFVGNLDSVEIQTKFQLAVLIQWAQQDPETALAMTAGLENDDKLFVVGAAIKKIAAADPQRGLEMARSLQSSRQRQLALYQVFSAWIQIDPLAAASAMLQSDNDSNWEQYAGSIAGQLASADPATALALAEQLQGREGNWLPDILSTIAQEDMPMALDYLKTMQPSQFRSKILSDLLRTLAWSDPHQAIAQLSLLPEGQTRDRVTRQIGSAWASIDSAAAFDWVLEQPARLQRLIIPTLAYRMIPRDPDRAIERLNLLEDDQVRSSWVSSLVPNYAARDPAAAAAWIEEYAGNPQYPDWLGAIADQWVLQDPAAALDLLDGIEDPDRYDQALVSLTNIRADQDSVATARWLSGLPGSRRTPAQFASVAGSWFRFDPEATIRWAQNLSRAAERDAAIGALTGFSDLRLSRKIALINRISNQQDRYTNLRSAAAKLARYNLDSAHDLIRRTRVSWQQRDEVAQMIENLGSTSEPSVPVAVFIH